MAAHQTLHNRTAPRLSYVPGRSRWFFSLASFAMTLALLVTAGCATRLNRHEILDKRNVIIDLVTVREGLFKTQARDFEHPAIISFDRTKNILGAIEVETSEDDNRFLRQPAIHPEILDDAAAALVTAFAESDPNSQLGVKLIRKEAKLGLFHTKYLTSFLAHMKDDHLYITFSKIEWEIPQSKENGKLPEPQPGGSTSRFNRFRVVSGEPLYFAGTQSLEIDWRSAVFQKPFRLPGSVKGSEKRREVLIRSNIPASERKAAKEGGGAGLDDLSPDALRALADLEEERREGRMTEAAYQRAKRDLLRKR